MAKDTKKAQVLPLEGAPQEKLGQNTELGFETEGVKYRVVDFHEEMTAMQDEDLIALIGDILPAVSALGGDDEASNMAALSMLVEGITGEKALLRRVLAILFLPETENRVYKRADVEKRIEIIGNLPNKYFLPLLGAVKDFFVFAGANFRSVSAIFSLTQK
jgi:hypothetical protein